MSRTKLKESRNETLLFVWLGISFVSIASVFFYDKEKSLCIIIGIQFSLLLYRVLTYCFNSLLLVFFRGKKYKINRLKGRITPIYELEDWEVDFKIKRYSVYYTNLDLEWSVPFSVLFQEQEYLFDGEFRFNTIPENIEYSWEEKEGKRREKLALETAEEDKKQKKIDKLNKVFKDNYK